MARTYVFTISKHLYDLVRKIRKYGDTAVAYLTPDQIIDMNAFVDSYSQHWGPGSGHWVQFRANP